MVFSSSLFLLYFLPVFLLIYYLAARPLKNIVLLVGSILFYAWGAPKFIFVLLGTTLLDFILVQWMDKTNRGYWRKIMLCISVGLNVGLLFYFKYCNFFIESLNTLLGITGQGQIKLLQVIMPIGISFYTFETITYVVDVYRRVHKPLTNFWDYQTYIILFPKLIAGPIIRYHDIADSITNRSAQENIDNKLTGFYRFCLGLSKKVLVANAVGAYADDVFGTNITLQSGTTAWLGLLCYTMQIYFDFSGYSDMAIGLGKMMGFTFPENFNNPYTSQSITEFWRRWHITLGAWMRNYLYIPLGGNRVSNLRLYFNLWIVFLASGLWHGASWNFIIWGAYHGAFLILDRILLLNVYNRAGKLLSTLFTLLWVMLGWVFFRCETLPHALAYLKQLFSFNLVNTVLLPDAATTVWLIIACLLALFTYIPWGQKIQDKLYGNSYTLKRHIIVSTTCAFLFIWCLAVITASNFNPFIYFRF
jgi:alginate O-acetyltransferase complex protein AlgI